MNTACHCAFTCGIAVAIVARRAAGISAQVSGPSQ
jgi:hypothetical protein